MSIVSNNIKYLRRLNGLTQEQFARKIGIKRSLLGAYEEARANPNLTNLKNMAATFGVSVDSLLKNDLRKIRETPQLNTLSSMHTTLVPSPLLQDPIQEPTPLAMIMNARPVPAQEIPSQGIPRPIIFKSANYIDFEADIVESARPVVANTRTEEPLFRQPVVEPKPVVDKKESDFFQPAVSKTALTGNEIPLITKDKEAQYISHLYDASFLQKLPIIQLPGTSEGVYRAFESGADFPMASTLLVGQRLNTIHEMVDGETYLLLLKSEGTVYRRVFNQIRVKGVVALFSDVAGVANTEVSAREVVEVYKIVWFISKQMSLPQQIDLHRVKELVNELQKEIQHTLS